MKAQSFKNGRPRAGFFAVVAMVWLIGLTAAEAQQPAQHPLKWDAMAKELTPQPGLPTADFVFHLTNASDAEVIINSATASCGCTVPQLPSQPWVLAAGAHGDLPVSINLAGKTGTFMKTVTVFAANLPPEILTLTVHMPDSLEAMRGQNQQMAVANRQAVFKGDCAKCHAEPAHGKLGKELYAAACGVCHESKERATMVPDLKTVVHPDDVAYWKMMITIGKPGTLMPGFGEAAGGPLTDEQVDSLAKTLVKVFPGRTAASLPPRVPGRTTPPLPSRASPTGAPQASK